MISNTISTNRGFLIHNILKGALWENSLNLFGRIKNGKKLDGFGAGRTKNHEKFHETQSYRIHVIFYWTAILSP